MDDRRKRYLKLNLVSLFFATVSFISVTLAWFAYSGIVTTNTEVDVKAWYIEFNSNGQEVSNDVVISLSDVYPGMEIVSEEIDIKNNGDSDAMISYNIKSVRIFDETYSVENSDQLKDQLSHNLPFHINMSLSNTYANANDGTGKFVVSVSWPLDSDNDKLDTEWGNKAYQFQKAEAEKAAADATYQVRSSIEVNLSLEAAQYIEEGDAPDLRFALGNIQLYDIYKNASCTTESSSCLKMYVIDVNNKLSDSSVTLMPSLGNSYGNGTYANYTGLYNNLTGSWKVTHRALSVKDILSVTSNDILSTAMVESEISDQIVGFIDYEDRATEVINQAIQYNGYFQFKTASFPYFSSTKCYWLADDYNETTHFALAKIDSTYSKLYGATLYTSCSIIPVIEASKSNIT